MKNKLYRWKEQGLYLDDASYYDQSPYGYVYVDNITCKNRIERLFVVPYVRGLRQLAKLVNALNRTLIMPKLSCPNKVNLTFCNVCSWDDCCYNGFQNAIGYNFKAHVIIEISIFISKSYMMIDHPKNSYHNLKRMLFMSMYAQRNHQHELKETR